MQPVSGLAPFMPRSGAAELPARSPPVSKVSWLGVTTCTATAAISSHNTTLQNLRWRLSWRPAPLLHSCTALHPSCCHLLARHLAAALLHLQVSPGPLLTPDSSDTARVPRHRRARPASPRGGRRLVWRHGTSCISAAAACTRLSVSAVLGPVRHVCPTTPQQ